MATRSTIALEFDDGTVQQIYCHWDGYTTNNGNILFHHYSDPAKVRELMDLGDLSILGEQLGVQRPFDNPGKYGTPEYEAFKAQYHGMCLFYGRDRGESDVAARKFTNFQDYVQNHQYEEYEYILRTDGRWYIKSHHFNYVPLAFALERAPREDF